MRSLPRPVFLVAATVAALFAVASAPAAEPDPAERDHIDPGDVDRAADPCVDFFAYACGPWIQRHPIPADRSNLGRGGLLSLRNSAVVRAALDDAARPDASRSPAQRLVGDYWAACMDEPAVARRGSQPLAAALARIAALGDKRELAKAVAGLHAVSYAGQEDSGIVNALFGYTSSQDFDDAKRTIGMFDQGGLGLPDRDYYLRADAKSAGERRQYREYAARLFRLLGDTPRAAEAAAAAVLDIETELARASLDLVKRRDPANLNHKLSEAELGALMPSFALGAYLDTVGGPRSERYLVTAPDFFRGIEKLIQTRSLAAWKSYLRWWVVNPAAEYLSPPFQQAQFAFYGQVLRGAKAMRPRWQRCNRWIDRDLGEAVGRVFVERSFSGAAKTRAQELVRSLERAFAHEIDELPWMSAATRQAAQTKLRGILDKLGYPDQWRDYGSVAVSRADLVGDVQAAQAFEVRRQLAKIGKPVDRHEWAMTPATVDAYYDPQMNTINFPAGILQPPYFDVGADDAINLGAIGAVIGHELTHGFDDSGRKFDAVGNLRDWWTAEDSRRFEERAQCTAKQYSGYEAAGGLKVNGELTLGENLADLGGLRLAYRALEEGKKAGPVAGRSAEQRFFLAFAGGWCGAMRPEAERVLVQTNPHSPPRYRVNGVVSQMPEFAKAFSCQPGKPMAPVNQCRVW